IPSQGIWPKIARMIQKRPRVIWSVTTLALLAGVAFIPQLKADGVAQSELVLGASEARDGQEALGEHFPGGSGSPIQVIANEEELDDVANVMLDQSAIEDVSISSQDSPSGTAPVTEDGIQAFGPPGTPAPEPTVVDGTVLLQGTMSVPADSTDASQTVRDMRDIFADAAPSAMV